MAHREDEVVGAKGGEMFTSENAEICMRFEARRERRLAARPRLPTSLT